MKLLAQHGFGESDKIIEGIEKEFIHGVILSPRDIAPDKIARKLTSISDVDDEAILLFDPQFYVSITPPAEAQSIGHLEDYEDYFGFLRRSNLEREGNVIEHIRNTIRFQSSFDLTSIISPNIMITNSFDSASSLISRNFIRLTRQTYEELDDEREIYATLAVTSSVLANNSELQVFLNEITALDDPPDGFYILVSFNNSDNRTELFAQDVIRGWLLLNYSLKVNGFKVVNGYSDMLSPFLGAVGCDYGATGWWSNLRYFSMSRFSASSGIRRQPTPRYLSKALINRITHQELGLWQETVPDIINGLSTDDDYSDDEPTRIQEILQSWQSLSGLIDDFTQSRSIRINLNTCQTKITNALNYYYQLQLSFRPEGKSSKDHLEALSEGIRNFRLDAQV